MTILPLPHRQTTTVALLLQCLTMFTIAIATDHNAFIFMHISKTGGTWAIRHLPELLHAKLCDTPTWGKWDAFAAASVQFAPNRTCDFLTFEARLPAFRSLLGDDVLRASKLLTFIRNPLAHWLSAFEHILFLAQSGRTIGPRPTLHEHVAAVERNNANHFMLRNFQMLHFGVSVADALRTLEQFFWFGVTEEFEISIALLLCQVHGRVDADIDAQWLAWAREKKNAAVTANYTIDAGVIARLVALNRLEIHFHNLVLPLFWRRVRLQRACLSRSGIDLTAVDAADGL